MKINLQDLRQIAEEAGAAILRHYGAGAPVHLKGNGSPLTAADTASHDVIAAALERLSSGIPMLSEESTEILYAERRSWKRFWLVDPLDGTKEFLKQNDEFTVNIALVENGMPVVGVVHAPAKNVTYLGETARGAFVAARGEEPKPIRVAARPPGPFKAVISRSHTDKQGTAFLKSIGPYETTQMGSSLKFCLIAEGSAHVYPRFWPTMEWDTAAADCLVTAAGGYVQTLDKQPLRYNKENLENPWFVASSFPLKPQ